MAALARFSDTQVEQLKRIVTDVIHEELAKIGLFVNDDTGVAEARKDFNFMRWLRQAGNRTAQRVGWAVIAALMSGLIYIIKLGFDIYSTGKR